MPDNHGPSRQRVQLEFDSFEELTCDETRRTFGGTTQKPLLIIAEDVEASVAAEGIRLEVRPRV